MPIASGSTFAAVPAGWGQVQAICDWAHEHIRFDYDAVTPEKSASDTLRDRAGVCRDFSHLGITLCRALNMPARAVSAYAWQLDPPDFHAVFEVYLDGGWWLVDPTRLAPVEGLVRIGIGRDAADIAFLTTTGPCMSVSQSVTVVEAAGAIAG